MDFSRETGHTSTRNLLCEHCRQHLNGNSPVDYYWRDYTGKVPPDAIQGGHDINNEPTYIGQAFYLKIGILVGQIYPGKRGIYVTTSSSYVHYTEVGVKILCSGNPQSFVWENADSANLHLTTIGKHLVIGGFEDEKIINVGRAMYQGETIVAYYWRDFNGSIPEDAVPGGKYSNQTTYIGQALVPIGLLPTNIFRGQSVLKVPHSKRGVPTAVAPKILCSDNEKRFVWLNVTSETLHTSTIGKHLVVGGYEEGQKIYIGRVMYQGELIVGKVIGFNLSNIKMYFVYQDKEMGTTSFQIMTYIA